MKNRYLIIIFGFVLFCFIVLFQGLKNQNIYTPELKEEKKLPKFVANEFYTNEEISSEEILKESNFYLINIWSSWCLPCRDEHAFLMNLKKNISLKLVGINYKDNDNNAIRYLNDFRNPYSNILKDKNGTVSIQLGAYGVPETLILNKNKKIIKKIIGPINKKKYNEIIKLIR
jgi:cytochrome c biogenesis protein CcmG/thiol:disulfide interchange protein DsbE